MNTKTVGAAVAILLGSATKVYVMAQQPAETQKPTLEQLEKDPVLFLNLARNN